MPGDLVDHPTVRDMWRHDPPIPKPCWVCGELTEWIYLDLAYQHPDCDAYPSEGGDVRIVRGVESGVRIEYIGPPGEPFYVEEVPDARHP